MSLLVEGGNAAGKRLGRIIAQKMHTEKETPAGKAPRWRGAEKTDSYRTSERREKRREQPASHHRVSGRAPGGSHCFYDQRAFKEEKGSSSCFRTTTEESLRTLGAPRSP